MEAVLLALELVVPQYVSKNACCYYRDDECEDYAVYREPGVVDKGVPRAVLFDWEPVVLVVYPAIGLRS